MDVIVVREVSFASEAYIACKVLRNEVLRIPLGLTLSEQDVEGEERQMHLAAFDGDVVCGTLLLKPLTTQHIKFRQMAVRPSHQNKGIGRRLVLHAESLAVSKGFVSVELNARMYAQGFYEKLGYGPEEEFFTPFIEVTLETVKMVKKLA